ncbi:glycogen/starch/alpha-glucan phosphorylase [Shigella flexneri]
MEDKNHSENVCRVLYPGSSTYSGRGLRLRQEFLARLPRPFRTF